MADEQTPGTAPANTPPPQESDQLEGASLEGDDGGAAAITTTTNSTETTSPSSPKPPSKPKKGLRQRFSIYLVLFALIIIAAILIVFVAVTRGKSAKQNNQVTDQSLSQSDVSQLAQSDVTVGDVKQTLNVQSNAVFAGQVLIRKDLQVAGKIEVGGSLSLTGISVSGDSIFGQLQVNRNLSVSGDTSLQGQLSVQKSLNVNGSGTFNGLLSAPQINANTLQLNGDLNLTHHISAGGGTPGRVPGGALGGGGTASVGGSDTAGSIGINTGGSPSAGCLVTVNFTQRFNTTPHVVVTPIEAAAGSLQYYVTRSSSSFSICTVNAPAAGASFGFDYIVFD